MARRRSIAGLAPISDANPAANKPLATAIPEVTKATEEEIPILEKKSPERLTPEQWAKFIWASGKRDKDATSARLGPIKVRNNLAYEERVYH